MRTDQRVYDGSKCNCPMAHGRIGAHDGWCKALQPTMTDQERAVLSDEECDEIARSAVPKAFARIMPADNFTAHELRLLIRAAAARERERCAKVCDDKARAENNELGGWCDA